MPAITFKAKPRVMLSADDSERHYVQVPELKRSHCDMHAFRIHHKFGSYANSDIFPSVLRRAARDAGMPCGSNLYLDALPAAVAADTSGFLAVITINVE